VWETEKFEFVSACQAMILWAFIPQSLREMRSFPINLTQKGRAIIKSSRTTTSIGTPLFSVPGVARFRWLVPQCSRRRERNVLSTILAGITKDAELGQFDASWFRRKSDEVIIGSLLHEIHQAVRGNMSVLRSAASANDRCHNNSLSLLCRLAASSHSQTCEERASIIKG
jgi:hypothetical protein